MLWPRLAGKLRMVRWSRTTTGASGRLGCPGGGEGGVSGAADGPGFSWAAAFVAAPNDRHTVATARTACERQSERQRRAMSKPLIGARRAVWDQRPRQPHA